MPRRASARPTRNQGVPEKEKILAAGGTFGNPHSVPEAGSRSTAPWPGDAHRPITQPRTPAGRSAPRLCWVYKSVTLLASIPHRHGDGLPNSNKVAVGRACGWLWLSPGATERTRFWRRLLRRAAVLPGSAGWSGGGHARCRSNGTETVIPWTGFEKSPGSKFRSTNALYRAASRVRRGLLVGFPGD